MLTSAVLAARDGPVACAHVQSPASSPPRARRGFANSGRLYAMMWSPWASPRLRSCRRVGHEHQGLVVSRLREPLDVQFRQSPAPVRSIVTSLPGRYLSTPAGVASATRSSRFERLTSQCPRLCRGIITGAEQERQLGGGSPLSSLMVAKD